MLQIFVVRYIYWYFNFKRFLFHIMSSCLSELQSLLHFRFLFTFFLHGGITKCFWCIIITVEGNSYYTAATEFDFPISHYLIFCVMTRSGTHYIERRSIQHIHGEIDGVKEQRKKGVERRTKRGRGRERENEKMPKTFLYFSASADNGTSHNQGLLFSSFAHTRANVK